ncbi:hypothetical protein ScPMuIL_003350 [Solemya velum]
MLEEQASNNLRADTSLPSQTKRPPVGNCRSVTCSSSGNQYAKCSVGLHERIISVTMEVQESSTKCVRCRNWGSESSYLWVDGGCRAKFQLCTVDAHDIVCTSLACASDKFQKTQCMINDAQFISTATIEKQLSDAECRKCESYYHDDTSVTVQAGCRARFHVCYKRSMSRII